MQDPPKRTRTLTGSSVGQDEKSLCISKVLYEPINREAIEELAETRAAAQLGLRTDLAILLIRDKDALGLVRRALLPKLCLTVPGGIPGTTTICTRV